MDKLTYEATGVVYDAIDPFKRMAQKAGRETAEAEDGTSYLGRLGVKAMEDTRGESAFLYRNGDHYIAHVEEGLGTKLLVADAMELAVPEASHYGSIAQDGVAMIVNDMITLGAFPFGIAMHLAVGDAKWMENEPRLERLIDGWKMACIRAKCCWGGGETPILKDVVLPNTAVLSGSAVGKTIGLKRFRAEDVQAGDQIIFFESSGIHANGLSMAREIAKRLEKKYLAEVPGSGMTFGEMLLRRTHIYVGAIEAMLRLKIDIPYAVNITGHGWRKLMRAPQALTYVVEELPTEDPVFGFMQEHGNISDEEMYGTFNMKAGFAVFVPESEIFAVKDFARKYDWPFRIFRAGHVEAGKKQVVIEPKGIVFEGETLAVR